MTCMQAFSSLALKEWAVVVESLAAGKQILLLRKGGLYERHGRFSVAPKEFFFFPTYVHQMEQGVVSDAAPQLQTALRNKPADEHLKIAQYATVADIQWLDSRECVEALAELHCWTPETVEKRFTYKTAGLYLFVLRVYQLPQLCFLPMHKRYAGCRSWVDLDESLSTDGATPVLDEQTFAKRANAIKARLAL